MTIDIPEILTRPLSRIATDIADQRQRAALYRTLRDHRDRMEPSINAFEERREQQPVDTSAPLYGMPITVKDQIAVTGWKRNFGLDRTTNNLESVNASVVDQFANLGAVVTGKTALPPNAMDFQTHNRRRGNTNNPHNTRFTTGGSSGGGAAAVASGMSLLDFGADLAGSLRLPAAWCGVTSLTPTEGKLSGHGLLRGTYCLEHFARIGPITRRIEDLAYIWNCLSASPGTTNNSPTSLRIGLWVPNDTSPCDEATRTVWTNLAQTIDDPHLTVEPNTMPGLLKPDTYRLFGEIMGHETGALIPAPIRWVMRQDRGAARRSPGFLTHVHNGYRRSKPRLADNITRLESFRCKALADWSDWDAVILPVTGICAFEHLTPITDRAGVRDYDHCFDTLAGPLGYFDALTRFTVPVGLLGWPVITIPIGRDPNGLPMGAQITGRPHSESLLLDLAQRLAPQFGFV